MSSTKTNTPVPKNVDHITGGSTAKIGMIGNPGNKGQSSEGGQFSHMPSKKSYSGRMDNKAQSVTSGVNDKATPSGRLSNKASEVNFPWMPKGKGK